MVKNKYGAKKVVMPDGTTFDSTKEFTRWCELKLLERAGKISDLQRQVKYNLLPAITETYERYSTKTGKRLKDGVVTIEKECNYIADFVYRDNETGETVVEDVKGYKNGAGYSLFVLKRKMMLHFHGIRIMEV